MDKASSPLGHSLAKQQLRQTMRARLAALSAAELEASSARLIEALQQKAAAWCPVGATVALFGGIKGEPDLLPLLPWLAERDVRAAFFAMEEGELIARAVSREQDLERGPFGVWVPIPQRSQRVADAELTTLLVPGLAFGRHDNQRLGRGRGFYDKLFARADVKAQRLGIALACQLVDEVPHEAHDMAMDEVLCG